MKGNFFKIIFRTLAKHKTNTFINIAGLMVGLSSAILIMNYIYHELSFDNFHEKGEHIYRATGEGSMPDGKVISLAGSAGDIPEQVMDRVPGVEKSTRFYGWGTIEVTFDNKRFTDDVLYWVDSSFFEIFTFPMIEGNPELALDEPYSIVLTESTAHKYFGDSAMNQRLKVSGTEYKVTGIMEDIPENSSIRTDMVASITTMIRPDYNIVKSDGISFPQYYLLHPEANIDDVKQSFAEVADGEIEKRFGEYGIKVEHSLQPLSRMHLHSDFDFDHIEQGDIRNIYIFSALAFFIILIAVMNFINLVTAQSDSRAKEIGLRKVCGAVKGDLVRRFLAESVLMALMALILATALNELLTPYLSSMLDQSLTLAYWSNPLFLAGIIAFTVAVGILSGLYPAFYLSRFQPVTVLKGGHHGHRKPNLLRKVLVTLQLAISAFLIICLVLLNSQINFMKDRDPGFDRENVVVFQNLTPSIRDSYQSIKGEMENNPQVISVTASQSIPGRDRSVQNLYKQGEDPKSGMIVFENRIQHGYVETMGMQIVQGRDFNPEMKTDTAAFIINERAAKKLGLEEPIGEKIVVWNEVGTVIGVVKDFNFMSAHNSIDPLVFTMYQRRFNLISIRVKPGSTKETISYLGGILEDADASYVPDHIFLDTTFERFYKKEEQINKLISSAAILALILSILGLYGLTAFTIRKKVKEIGIRKALGGSVTGIMGMLLRDLLKWVVIGNLIAWPLAWLGISSWLQNFAYQIYLPGLWWAWMLALFLTLAIGVLTMLYHTLMAARANPVDALRYE